MKIIKAKDYKDMGYKAAGIIAAQIILKEDSVLGLATGSTVEGLYARLCELNREGAVDFSTIKSVNLDEYVNLPVSDKNSYRFFMDTNLFEHVNILPENTNLPDGMAKDLAQECLRYEALIAELGGVDLQLLGLGHNGHIVFNEPYTKFEKITNIVDLKESTIQANARFFNTMEEVPKQAITMGIQTIMRARHILLCVSGEGKAEILKAVLTGPVTPQVPGSILQLHPHVTIVADEDALKAF